MLILQLLPLHAYLGVIARYNVVFFHHLSERHLLYLVTSNAFSPVTFRRLYLVGMHNGDLNHNVGLTI